MINMYYNLLGHFFPPTVFANFWGVKKHAKCLNRCARCVKSFSSEFPEIRNETTWYYLGNFAKIDYRKNRAVTRAGQRKQLTSVLQFRVVLRKPNVSGKTSSTSSGPKINSSNNEQKQAATSAYCIVFVLYLNGWPELFRPLHYDLRSIVLSHLDYPFVNPTFLVKRRIFLTASSW
jgi:hypothetical protein